MIGRSIFCILCLLAVTCVVSAQNKHSKTTSYPTYKGLVMAGYQGWFHTPKEGQLLYILLQVFISASKIVANIDVINNY